MSREVHYSISGKKLYLFDDVEDQNIVTVTFHDVPKPLRADVLRHMADTIDDATYETIEIEARVRSIFKDLTHKQSALVLRLFKEHAKKHASNRERDVKWSRG